MMEGAPFDGNDVCVRDPQRLLTQPSGLKDHLELQVLAGHRFQLGSQRGQCTVRWLSRSTLPTVGYAFAKLSSLDPTAPVELLYCVGGVISPLLANIALHGLETDLVEHFGPRRDGFYPPIMVRYADDFVVFHRDQAVVEQCQLFITGWLQHMGLELKPSKTRITHTLDAGEQEPGFDFLGFNIRHHRAGKTRCAKNSQGKLLGYQTRIKPSKASMKRHVDKLSETMHRHRGADQEFLIKLLAPKIIGWCNYFSASLCSGAFAKLSSVLFAMLLAWATRRHPQKGHKWVAAKYWRVDDRGGWRFQPRGSDRRMPKHSDILRRRHIKVAGRRSPFDGDWLYWSARLGREPTTPSSVAKLLKKQHGRCAECGLYFRSDDRLEVDHVHPRAQGGTGARKNLQLLHRHCHDRKTARDKRCA